MSNRTPLCRANTAFGRDWAYLTDDGIDVDSSANFKVVRRRVFFDDVQLVTLHRDRGAAFLIFTGLFGAFFIAMAVFIVAVNVEGWRIAVVPFVIGLVPFTAFVIRLAVGRAVVTVFGRRSRATLRFHPFRTQRAREVYGRICAAVRRAQSERISAPESPPPPLPEDVPLPPP